MSRFHAQCGKSHKQGQYTHGAWIYCLRDRLSALAQRWLRAAVMEVWVYRFGAAFQCHTWRQVVGLRWAQRRPPHTGVLHRHTDTSWHVGVSRVCSLSWCVGYATSLPGSRPKRTRVLEKERLSTLGEPRHAVCRLLQRPRRGKRKRSSAGPMLAYRRYRGDLPGEQAREKSSHQYCLGACPRMEPSPTLVCLNRPVRVAHERPGRRWLDRTDADC